MNIYNFCSFDIKGKERTSTQQLINKSIALFTVKHSLDLLSFLILEVLHVVHCVSWYSLYLSKLWESSLNDFVQQSCSLDALIVLPNE